MLAQNPKQDSQKNAHGQGRDSQAPKGSGRQSTHFSQNLRHSAREKGKGNAFHDQGKDCGLH